MTKQPQHTPGPWEIQEHSWSDTSVVDSNGRKIAALSIYSIATEATQAQLEPQMDADARLIAASPTMHAYIQKKADNGCEEAKSILDSLL